MWVNTKVIFVYPWEYCCWIDVCTMYVAIWKVKSSPVSHINKKIMSLSVKLNSYFWQKNAWVKNGKDMCLRYVAFCQIAKFLAIKNFKGYFFSVACSNNALQSIFNKFHNQIKINNKVKNKKNIYQINGGIKYFFIYL